jgi:hypothetical protein
MENEMPRQRLSTATVLLPDGTAVLVTPDQDLPEGVTDDDINPAVFAPWGAPEDHHDVEGLEYDEMTAKELAKLARERNLEPESGKKADLITALEEADASDN